MDDFPQTPLDYAPRRKPASWARMLAYLLVSLAFLALLLFILAPVLYHLFHHHDHRPMSGSNLRQIAQVAHSYAVDHDGHYPDSFETMVRWEHSYLPPQLFASPDGPATPASDFETMFAEPGHISYVWVGAGLTVERVTGEIPLAYEGPVTDYETGTLVAFVNGSVRRVKGEELRKLLSEAEERLKRAAARPATRPATQVASD